MPEITPFQGFRYNTSRFTNNLSKVASPPYDVLDAVDKADLLEQNDRNVVAIDLPHVPPKSAGPDEAYQRSAKLLDQWISDGTLVQEDQPALYVYHQAYHHGHQRFTRRMFFARMRLEPFGEGTVFPHEHTFGGPKEDRLKLMQATGFQLSPIFGLYSDRRNSISHLLDVGESEPDAMAESEGVVHELWVQQNPAILASVCREFSERPVYIADGHHRYSTALTYRNWLAEQSGGSLPEDHPANFVLVGLCAMEDPGCIILPTHRVITDYGDLSLLQLVDALKPGLECEPAELDLDDPDRVLPEQNGADVALYLPDSREGYFCRFTKRAVLKDLAADHSEAWQSLDLAYLHRYLIDELLTRQALNNKPPKVHCIKSLDDTLRKAEHCNGLAIITRACTMEDLKAVSDAGDLMPQKSTFFYPKLATGMVLNPLTDTAQQS